MPEGFLPGEIFNDLDPEHTHPDLIEEMKHWEIVETSADGKKVVMRAKTEE